MLRLRPRKPRRRKPQKSGQLAECEQLFKLYSTQNEFHNYCQARKLSAVNPSRPVINEIVEVEDDLSQLSIEANKHLEMKQKAYARSRP
jgi:hypothetical protein